MDVSNSTISCNISETDQESRDVFCQMDLLRAYNDDLVWKEVRRWVKFEEVLEEKGKRWSKPHVSSLHMQRLTELQMLLASNPILLDLEVSTMSELADALLERWRSDGHLEPLLYNHVRAILMKRHKHHHIHRKQVIRSESKRQLSQMLTLHDGGYDSAPSSPATKRTFERNEKSFPDLTTVSAKLEKHENMDMSKSLDHLAFDAQPNKKFLRKIPEGAEVCNILVGHVEELKSSLGAFVRLKEAKDLGNITEVSLPTKFVFILLVPKNEFEHSAELGRCIGTLMTDWLFREVAYSCMDKVTLMSAVMEFASQVTVLPPGCWDPKTRIDPPENLPSKESRKSEVSIEMSVTSDESHEDDTLERTGRLFGGLIKDIKRKAPWYKSDFTDAAHVQCFASFFYLFLATLTPNVAFGGLLGVATEQYMGTMECILSSAVSGVIFALFSGQPLNILGSTGPMLVLEMILFNLCKDNGWNFLPARVWVGFWMAFYILLIVAFDLSALVKYITRFTEESFACLIALIFIYQAVAKTISIQNTSPLELHPSPIANKHCLCIMGNFSTGNDSIALNTTSLPELTSLKDAVTQSNWFGFEFATKESHIQTTTISPSVNTTHVVEVSKFSEWMENCTTEHGTLFGDGCDLNHYVPDVFLFSILIFIGTAAFAFCFVMFRNSLFCPTVIRQTVSDFSVLLAIVIMVGIDLALGLPTPKLTVPSEFKPTRSDRGWFINPISDNPWWLVLASSVPALLGTILIFMDQQITSVIVNRKENKLKKGGGYHLDMLVVAVLIVILSLLGLPWYVAATVTAIAHVMSLKKVSECTAPGEKPVFLGVREQRVTTLLVGVFSGLAVLITSVLQYIPMPVLYGVFFFMGVSALNGMQLVDRILIMFMPQKYQPDLPYLRHVPLPKVHLFTAIQIICLAILWVVKSVKVIAIAFPLMVVAICFVRKGLEFFYSEHELKWLDDILPSFKKDEEDGSKPMDKQSIIPVHDHGSGGRKKFQRSLSVPASVHASGTTSTTDVSVGSCMDLPYLHRAISSESLSKVVMLSARNLSKRKLSLLSLPVNPSFVLEETSEEKKHAAHKNKTGIYKQNSHSHV